MREILFRGKRKDNGEWVEGNYGEYYNGEKKVSCISNPKESISGSLCYDVILKTVGQYTGLTDKNGNKIFEGDIISTSSKLIGAVEWNNTFAKYIVCYNQLSGNWFDFEGEDCFSVALDCVIIGNIHDNPELLEGDKT